MIQVLFDSTMEQGAAIFTYLRSVSHSVVASLNFNFPCCLALLLIFSNCTKELLVINVVNHTKSEQHLKGCFFEANYPEISSKRLSQEVAKKINTDIKSFWFQVQRQNETKYQLRTKLQACRELQQGASYNISYEIKHKSHDLLSILFETHFEAEWAFHGLRLNHGINFRLTDGTIITPELLFSVKDRRKFEEVYYQTIRDLNETSTSCRLNLKRLPPIPDAQSTYFDEDNFVVFFNVYEIAPYACADFKFLFPLRKYSALMSLDTGS